MQFTFKREAMIMTVLLVSPLVLGLFAGFATFLFARLAANAHRHLRVTGSYQYKMVPDSPRYRHAIPSA